MKKDSIEKAVKITGTIGMDMANSVVTAVVKLPTLKIVTKQPFGRLWPNCDASRAIARVAKRQTFSKEELMILSDEGGFDIEVE